MQWQLEGDRPIYQQLVDQIMMQIVSGQRKAGDKVPAVRELAGFFMEEKRARVKVLRSTDKWYGVTYREDKPQVVAAIAAMTQSGLYPERLWDI